MILADKTIYIEHLDKTYNYLYTFLRPCQFGKSAFLNMFCMYYDIHNAYFNDLFGPLYIGKNPTPWHNKHWSSNLTCHITVSQSIKELRMTFNDDINGKLQQ